MVLQETVLLIHLWFEPGMNWYNTIPELFKQCSLD